MLDKNFVRIVFFTSRLKDAYKKFDESFAGKLIDLLLRSTLVHEYALNHEQELLSRSRRYAHDQMIDSDTRHARMVAIEMVHVLGRDEAIEKSKNKNFSDLDKYSLYLINHCKMLGPNVYNKFLTEMCTHIVREPKYYTDPKSLGYKIQSLTKRTEGREM